MCRKEVFKPSDRLCVADSSRSGVLAVDEVVDAR